LEPPGQDPPVANRSEKPDETGNEEGEEIVVEDETVDESSRSDNFAFSIKENVGGEIITLMKYFFAEEAFKNLNNVIFNIQYGFTEIEALRNFNKSTN
jgi:hypothetical protein